MGYDTAEPISRRDEWVHEHLGSVAGTPAYKRLILSHHKNLNRRECLIDDRPDNGTSECEGEWVKFGAAERPDWSAVTAYLLPDPEDTE